MYHFKWRIWIEFSINLGIKNTGVKLLWQILRCDLLCLSGRTGEIHEKSGRDSISNCISRKYVLSVWSRTATGPFSISILDISSANLRTLTTVFGRYFCFWTAVNSDSAEYPLLSWTWWNLTVHFPKGYMKTILMLWLLSGQLTRPGQDSCQSVTQTGSLAAPRTWVS